MNNPFNNLNKKVKEKLTAVKTQLELKLNKKGSVASNVQQNEKPALTLFNKQTVNPPINPNPNNDFVPTTPQQSGIKDTFVSKIKNFDFKKMSKIWNKKSVSKAATVQTPGQSTSSNLSVIKKQNVFTKLKPGFALAKLDDISFAKTLRENFIKKQQLFKGALKKTRTKLSQVTAKTNKNVKSFVKSKHKVSDIKRAAKVSIIETKKTGNSFITIKIKTAVFLFALLCGAVTAIAFLVLHFANK